jgi:hypothetical protein
MVTLLSLTDTLAEPAATPFTDTTLPLTETTVATALLEELAEMVPEALLTVTVPVAPAESDSDAGDTVIDGVTVTGRLTLPDLVSRT